MKITLDQNDIEAAIKNFVTQSLQERFEDCTMEVDMPYTYASSGITVTIQKIKEAA